MDLAYLIFSKKRPGRFWNWNMTLLFNPPISVPFVFYMNCHSGHFFHEKLSKCLIWLKIDIFIAYICLKVFENGSLCCIISSFYPIFLSKSLLKSVILRKNSRKSVTWSAVPDAPMLVYFGVRWWMGQRPRRGWWPMIPCWTIAGSLIHDFGSK